MPNMTSLNEEQRMAVEHGTGPLLIIAGAGTGKTTVISQRIQHLILEKNVSPSNILALTFTEKAAAEMETRIDQILPYGYTQMWIETFHAFCDRILRQEAINIGLNPGYDLLTEAEALLFLRKNLFKFELDYFRPLGNPMKFLQGMLQHFSRLKDDDITPEQYLEYAKKLLSFRATDKESRNLIPQSRSSERDPSTRSSVGMTKGLDVDAADIEIKKTLELANAFKTYEDLKAKEGKMDFSDLISNVLKLFRSRKNILEHYQNLFHYILVDEFQDTNYAQNEMAILLAGEKQNITVVGDDDQSIYRWRGAAIANMMQFRSHFPKANIVALTQNYRSTQTILDSAYRLIQNNNPDRLEVKEKINKRLVAMRTEILPDPPFNKGGKQITSPPFTERGLGGFKDVSFIYAGNAEEEAEEVAKKIRDEVKKNKRAYKDFAILVRANDHALPFQRALDRLHIPYQFLGPGHLFQQEEIKDLIAYLHALANFEDAASLYRVLTLPIFDVEARDVAAMLNFAKRTNVSLFEAMERVETSMVTSEGQEKIKRIVDMLKRHLERVPRETAGQILYYFFEDSGLLGYYLDPRSARTEKEAQNIAKFFEKMQSFATNHEDASVFAVVDWIDLSMELGESPMAAEVDWTNTDAVNILTIHSSKGLEFPVVFVVNLVTLRFPSRDRKEQIPVPQGIIRETLPEGNENLQEERRLFYVAITRAQDTLFLSAAKFYGEGKRERKISPFVIETLGEEAINTILKKQKLQQSVQQLTLLDMFNTNIKQEQKTEKNGEWKMRHFEEVSALVVENGKSEMHPVTYISYSQLQTFLSCPLHYKLRYIMNVPTPPSPALNYGISVHSSLRDFFQQISNKEPVNASIMHAILKKNWIHLGYSSKVHEEQAYRQADTMLFTVAEQTLTEKPNTIAIELPFNFWLSPQARGLKVGGRIDRVDQLPDGRIEIIDYKTGNNVPDEKKIKDDLQLSFYALAATQIREGIFNKTPEEVFLTLYYVEPNIRISTVRTKADLEIAKEKITTLVEQISQSSFHCNGSIFCKNCEYKMLCSTYRD